MAVRLGLETGGEILILSIVTSVGFLGIRPCAFSVIEVKQCFTRLSIPFLDVPYHLAAVLVRVL